jgi:hypothetical protein
VLCEKITQDSGDYRVVLFSDHAWSACTNWFPRENILNCESIAHGSDIRNNWHRENARDAFLVTVDRASAFLSGAVPIPFVEKSHFLHIGNNPKKVRSTTRKEKKLQRDPEAHAREEEERARKERAREEEERTRKEEERSKREMEEEETPQDAKNRKSRKNAQH